MVAPKGAVFDELRLIYALGFFLGILGQKYSLDVRKNTSLCDCDTGQKFVQLLVITDSQLKVTGNDPDCHQAASAQ